MRILVKSADCKQNQLPAASNPLKVMFHIPSTSLQHYAVSRAPQTFSKYAEHISCLYICALLHGGKGR